MLRTALLALALAALAVAGRQRQIRL